jgi:hypothetical protein
VAPDICRDLGPGSGSLHGSTPAGPLDLSNAWLDVHESFPDYLNVTFGAARPRRDDAVPSVSIKLPSDASLAYVIPSALTADAEVRLCDKTLSVPAKVTLTTKPGFYLWAPLVGTFVIDAPGWNVTGTFSFDTVCQDFSSQ